MTKQAQPRYLNRLAEFWNTTDAELAKRGLPPLDYGAAKIWFDAEAEPADVADIINSGTAGRGSASQGAVGQGLAWDGRASRARMGETWRGRFRQALARSGMARPSKAGRGRAWFWHGGVPLGRARLGVEWQGKARLSPHNK